MPLLNKLENILIAYRPDIIHLQVPSLISFAIRLLARSKDIPVTIGIHDLPMNIAAFSPLLRNGVSKIARWLLTKWYDGADVLISPSQYGKEYYRALGVSGRIQVISNGVDLNTFQYRVDKARNFKDKYLQDFDSSKALLLYVGRISPEKNLEILMTAMKKIDGILTVIGEAGSEKYLHNLGKNADSHKIVFTGKIPLDDLVGAYSASDVLVQPSTHELQSLVILEALSCGLPIVGANYAAIPELVLDGNNGFLFQPFDEEDLADKINLVINQSKTKRKSMFLQSLAVAGEHSLERSTPQYIELYSSITR